MNRNLFAGAFAVGAVAVLWVALGFLGVNHLAFLMTLVIACTYVLGAWELHQFRQATDSLKKALQELPEGLDRLDTWLVHLHSSLQNMVRLRVEGERVALPGPALTPYLVGLLVMLGMLGTFLGMVVTLNGAVFALEGTKDLETIRQAFATPIKGLGLSFGTSVAGVAASAMLGLMSAMARRERLHQAQVLDTRIATSLHKFTLAYQREETYKALQTQSQAMPAMLDQIQHMMSRMERMSEQFHSRLLTGQEHFHQEAREVYTELARSVDQTLRNSLTESAQAAAQGIEPIVLAAMNALTDASSIQHARVIASTQSQLDAVTQRLSATAEQVTLGWTAAAKQQEHNGAAMVAALAQEWKQSGAHTLSEISRLSAAAEALAQSRMAADTAWSQQQEERLQQMVSMLRGELSALREEESLRGNAAVDRLSTLQADVQRHLTTLGTALEEPIARLVVTASEAPRAAADVIGKLRQEVSQSVARDNELLEERTNILATLHGLLEGIQRASVEQRAVIDALLASSAEKMDEASQRFAHEVDTETTKLSDIADHVTSSAVEVTTLGETLRFVVQSFHEANEKSIASLARIEGALEKAMARSDDQLAYYVAQAREIIDLSLLSHKEMVDGIRNKPAQAGRLASEVSA